MVLEIIVREAEPSDAGALIDFLDQVGRESHFLDIDEVGVLMRQEDMAGYLAQMREKDNNAYFLALGSSASDPEGGDTILGVLSVTADFRFRVRHIGHLFVAVKKEFQGLGIASFLFQDMIDWVEEVGVIKRLELTCQERNQAARKLYQKFDFEVEVRKIYGARDEEGHLINTLQMIRLF